MSILELSEQEIVRRNSLAEMRKLGIDPYPAAEYVVTGYTDEIKENFKDDAPVRHVSIAGRIMSRAQAKKQISLNEFENSMAGIYSSSVCAGTLDESPMAYKPTGEILELIRPTVEVIAMIKTKLNIKDNGE